MVIVGPQSTLSKEITDPSERLTTNEKMREKILKLLEVSELYVDWIYTKVKVVQQSGPDCGVHALETMKGQPFPERVEGQQLRLRYAQRIAQAVEGSLNSSNERSPLVFRPMELLGSLKGLNSPKAISGSIKDSRYVV